MLRREPQGNREVIMSYCRVLLGTVSLVALSVAGVLVVVPAADARVTKIQITSKQSPTFGGYAFEASVPTKGSSAKRSANSIRRTPRMP